MAQSHEMLLEVKLDLKKDAKNDSCLKNWVNWMKCHVKIDAIECFPCYLKISFYHEDDSHREYPFSIIRLNIPGVQVGSAASRTKSFTYGIFWKNNRKRCRLFLAFHDKQACSMHMKWLKQCVDSLELYRKDILENHRISRSIINAIKTSSDGKESQQLNTSKSCLNDTQIERNMNDILGPLPDIPVSNGDCSCTRLSIRRSSGCSGIYEEILDPTAADVKNKREQESRGSIVSGIYVDMSAHLKSNMDAEMPPELPPRRYTPINQQSEPSLKTRKSVWNLKNVFGRTKITTTIITTIESSKSTKCAEVVKSQTATSMSKLCASDCASNLLANSKNSFSTPDLTNMVDSLGQQVPTPIAPPIITDETDLDVMDIERSNSLNCSTNQFACRPPAPLNISDNILWSHNLSITLSSTADSSAINLVGANVNSRDSFLGRDVSGYCKMAPILKKSNRKDLMRSSTLIYDSDDQSPSNSNQLLLDSSSFYCPMAPIFRKNDSYAVDSNADVFKNITFERTFDFDDEDQPPSSSSILDSSMKLVEHHSNHASLNDITTSSGVSSFDGNTVATCMRCITPMMDTTDDRRKDSDDAISLTYTESPSPQSAQSNHMINDNPFVYQSSKFDQKTPSYFPNDTSTVTTQDTTKYYTVNTKTTKQYAKSNRKTDPIAIIPSNNNDKECNAETTPNINLSHFKNTKRQIYKGVLKTPTSGKVQKLKQRRGSIPDSSTTFEHHPTAIPYKNENWYNENGSRHTHAYHPSSIEHRKFDTLPSHKFHETKKVLSHLDPNTKYEPNRHTNFEKKTKIKSSPRRIYNKWSNRLKTPPSTPNESMTNDQLNSSLDSALRTSKNCHTSSSSDSSSSNGLIRSWARFRKIDFSPLKTKINSIWQRPNSDY